ncbi:hypothetical protein V6Z11_D10G001700 [Gossypium hirsutum]
MKICKKSSSSYVLSAGKQSSKDWTNRSKRCQNSEHSRHL